MPIALSAAAMIPAAGEIGAAGAAFGPVGLAIAAVIIVGCIAYEAGFFDWLGDVLEDGWNWLKNGFGKVVQKAKSVVQEDIIPGVLDGIDWICKAVGAKGKGETKEKSGDKEYKNKKKVKGKQKDDIPDRFKGEKPYKGESGKDAAKRVLKEHGEYDPKDTGPTSNFNKLKKHFDYDFE